MTQQPSTNFSSSWTNVDQTSDPSFYPALLEATRAPLLERARRDPETVFAPLGLHAGMGVLDVGCGTGDYLRLLAPLVHPGPAIGVDLSHSLITHARQSTSPDSANVAFVVGDATVLPLADQSFDRVIATQVLLHLSDPWAAVDQIRRVLAPGGQLMISEWDWDSTCLAVTDTDLGRRFTHLLCDQMSNGLIVRDLPWQLAEHGYTNVEVTPQVHLTRTPDAAHQWLIQPATRQLVRAGKLSEQDGTALLADLQERAETGRYFLSRISYAIRASVP